MTSISELKRRVDGIAPAPAPGENLAWLPDAEIERRVKDILAAHDPAEDDPTMAQCRVIMARREPTQDPGNPTISR